MNTSFTAFLKLAMMPADSTVTKVTSASPIISADAVEAVRCGLRMVLSRASSPIVPAIRVAGQPSQVASRGTMRADSSATPTKINTAPRPMRMSTGPVPLATNRPSSSPTRPSSAVAADVTVRYLARRPSGRVAPSRTAAIGSTRVARIAGRRLARTVTTTPTRMATMIVRPLTTVPVLGSVTPAALNRANSPWARARPTSSPTTEATAPITNDSTRIERRTCLREAPSVRSVANSRVRWAMVIESELAITKLPTNSATPANTSRKVLRKVRKPVIDDESWLACWAPVRTWVSEGRTGRIWATSCLGLIPGLALARISSSLPVRPSRRWAVVSWSPASVAPPSEDAEPNFTSPEIFSWTTGPTPCTPMSSPALRFFLLAVVVSMTTPPGPGQLPLTSRSELNWGLAGSTLKPRLGAPPEPIVLPFLTSCRLPDTSPMASLTPGSPWTRPSSDWLNGGTSPLAPAPPVALLSMTLRPVTVASVPW